MHLKRLRIERIRNLNRVELNQLQPFNIFYGNNGSGKSSLLEAIHLLATGKSFRTNLVKQYIQQGELDGLIYAESGYYRLGLQKFSSGEQIIRLNGDTVATQSELARLLPVQLIDPDTVSLLDTGSKPRRQLLDWLMFHVEPEFHGLWLRYQRALKQRNNLLKQPGTDQRMWLQSMQSWEHGLAEYGELIHGLREKVMQQWLPLFEQYRQILLPDIEVSLSYLSGFDPQSGLLASLDQHRQRDMERTTTQHGPHRADLRLKTALGLADEVLSRGQKKLLMVALKLSQIHMLQDLSKETVVLLDDFSAELDDSAQGRLLSILANLNSQVFMTILHGRAVQDMQASLDFSRTTVFEVSNGQLQAQFF
ncbi:DNA replication/repair protein RecF [Alkanindiges sp. WGS2144]|uniref:DNA replication/repair protein RecF n=1 Tax=Alkanindiges sp. WGS2144 TaxID=3366808 RepID=UPI003753E461